MTETTTTTEVKYLTTAEAAARAKVALRTVQDWVSKGKLRARRHRASGRLQIDASDLEELLQGDPIEPVRG